MNFKLYSISQTIYRLFVNFNFLVVNQNRSYSILKLYKNTNRIWILILFTCSIQLNKINATADYTAELSATSTSICQGSSTDLKVTITGGVAPFTVVYSDGTNSITVYNYNSDDLINVSPGATTTYSLISVTDNASESAISLGSPVVITVNDLPTANIVESDFSGVTNDLFICTGGSATLTASGGSTYVWSNTESTESITVSPTTNTSYYVTVTDNNGCMNTSSVTISVNDLPTANILETDASGNNDDSFVCTGGSATLTASGGVSYVWSTMETTESISVSPSGFTSYTVTVTDNYECTNSTSASIDVFGPSVSESDYSGAVYDDSNICSGEQATLTASGGDDYSWSTGSNSNSITISPSSNYTYTVTVSYAGCSSELYPAITVNSLPVVTCPSDFSICISAGTVALTGEFPTGGNFSGDGTSGDMFDPLVAGVGSHIINYDYSDFNQCYNSCSFNITVTGIAVTCSGDFPVCTYDAVMDLSTIVWPSGGDFTIDGFSSSSSFDPSTQSIGTHSIVYTVTDGNACSNYCGFNISVYPVPIINFTYDETSGVSDNDGIICYGASVTINASGGSSYFWSTGSTDDHITVSPSSTTSYTVSIIDPYGCNNSTNIVVNVNSIAAAPTCPDDISICVAAADIDLSILGASPGGGSFSGTGITTSPTFSPASAGTGVQTITYTYFDGNACSNDCTFNITVDANPTPDAGSDKTICGLTTYMEAIASIGSGTWSQTSGPGNATFIDANNATTSVTVDAYGSYNFTWTEINANCVASNDVNITFYSYPTVTTYNSCVNGSSVTFTQSNGETGGTWTVSGGGSIDPSSGEFTPSTIGCFTATYTTPSANCSDTKSFLVYPETPPAPVSSNTCNAALEITNSPDNPGFYIQFSFDDGINWQSSNVSAVTDAACYAMKMRWINTDNTCDGTMMDTPNCESSTGYALIYPETPPAPQANNSCVGSTLAINNTPSVSGFTIEYSFDDGISWQASATLPANNSGNYAMKMRWTNNNNCGSTLASTPSCESATGNAVVFPDGLIYNLSSGKYFCSLEDALNDASTHDGDEFQLQSGTYTACTTININVTITAVGGTVTLSCIVMDGIGKNLTLGSDLNITSLNLMNGKIHTSGHNLSCGSLTGGSSASYVVTD